MSKILVICTLLCTFSSYFALADDVKDLHQAIPATVSIDGYFYTLWKTNTSIYLNSTKEDFKPCTISVNPVKDYAFKIQANAIRNDKLILWGIRRLEVPPFHQSGIVHLTYTVLIIDSLSCSYKAVSIPEVNIPSDNWQFISSHVLPATDGFDFFSPSQGNCSPCRFSLEGEPIAVGYQLETKDIDSDYARNIQLVDEKDSSKGYIFTYNFDSEKTAAIKLLDSKFKVVKQALLKNPIHSLSINYNKEPSISICYASQNSADSFWLSNFQVHCEQLDSDFNSKLKVRLPVPQDRYVFGLGGITHRVDLRGNMFIGLMQMDLQFKNNLAVRQLRFFSVDKTGKLVETQDYEKSDSQLGDLDELQSHFSADKKFCILRHAFTNIIDLIAPADVQEFIKCVDVVKYLV